MRVLAVVIQFDVKGLLRNCCQFLLRSLEAGRLGIALPGIVLKSLSVCIQIQKGRHQHADILMRKPHL